MEARISSIVGSWVSDMERSVDSVEDEFNLGRGTRSGNQLLSPRALTEDVASTQRSRTQRMGGCPSTLQKKLPSTPLLMSTVEPA